MRSTTSRATVRGVSLLEVLIATGIMSVGLLALAALLPIGRVSIAEGMKVERGGIVGRAALRDVKVRRMLDPQRWTAVPTTASFVIDPLGVTNGLAGAFGGKLSRISLTTADDDPAKRKPLTKPQAEAIFRSHDDLVFVLPEEMNPKQPKGRPTLLRDTAKAPCYQGHYTWFATACSTSDPRRFVVTAVVCYMRGFDAASAEKAVGVSQFGDSDGTVAYGGGSVTLAGALNTAGGLKVRENDWVALCNSKGISWYRVVAISDDSTSLTLSGPDWRPDGSDVLVAVGKNVVGAFTTSVDLSVE